MKLLLDENLSRRMLALIQDLFPGSIHVTQAGLSRATTDRKIRDYALRNGFVILTADTDFISLANTLGPPPKVILLENCDYPTSVAAKVIHTNGAENRQI
jgi:predicted nuclease of predicted toxin-antitoxin system